MIFSSLISCISLHLAIFEYRFQMLYVKIREFLYIQIFFTFFDDGEIKEQPKLEVGDVSKQGLFNLISKELFF